ncbi:MAG: hypothetical protein KJ621_14490 [Proteobacteria bacterium]|nr:hypothetical protein [Pseudomonadota bacterium]
MTLGLAVLAGIYLTSLYNYLLFHAIVELFSIAVACGIFMFAWNFRRFFYNNYLLFLGVAYLFVAGLDFVHLLAYKGLGVFPGYGANLPTQLWIAARSLQAASIILTIGSELAFTFTSVPTAFPTWWGTTSRSSPFTWSTGPSSRPVWKNPTA